MKGTDQNDNPMYDPKSVDHPCEMVSMNGEEVEQVDEATYPRPENINSPGHRDRSEGLSDRQIRMKKT